MLILKTNTKKNIQNFKYLQIENKISKNILLIHHSVTKTYSDKINTYFDKLVLENTKFKLISIDLNANIIFC